MSTKIESIKFLCEVDDCADTSYLGEYTDKYSPWAILRVGEYAGEFCAVADIRAKLAGENGLWIPERGREYRFFRPYAGGEKPGTKEYRIYGAQDYARVEGLNSGDWCFLHLACSAVVSRDIGGGARKRTMFRSAGLGGVESDSEAAYLEEIYTEEFNTLLDELRAYGVPVPEYWEGIEITQPDYHKLDIDIDWVESAAAAYMARRATAKEEQVS